MHQYKNILMVESSFVQFMATDRITEINLFLLNEWTNYFILFLIWLE